VGVKTYRTEIHLRRLECTGERDDQGRDNKEKGDLCEKRGWGRDSMDRGVHDMPFLATKLSVGLVHQKGGDFGVGGNDMGQ